MLTAAERRKDWVFPGIIFLEFIKWNLDFIEKFKVAGSLS